MGDREKNVGRRPIYWPKTSGDQMSDQPIPASLQDLAVPVASLKHYSKNPRQGDVGAIVESLRVNGQYRPVVVNRRTDEVLAGNHTLRAARQLGWSEIAATFVDVDEEQAARIALVDNRANDLAAYNDAALLELLTSLPSFDGTGFSGDDVDELIAELNVSWADAMGGLPSGDRDPFQQMTFTLHDDQAEVVSSALAKAKDLGAFAGPNTNQNGNAIARVCAMFLESYG